MRLALCFSLVSLLSAQTAPAPKRTLQLDDLFRMEDVGDLQVSPDGQWIAYTVTRLDREGDKEVTNLWMVSWDGKQTLQLTYGLESLSLPRWSKNGRYLSFLSDRPGKAKGDQIWLMDRRGGEARQLTETKDKISDYAWSPDGKRLVIAMREPNEPEPDIKNPAVPPPPPKPIVIDRYHFKEDEKGYVGSKFERLHLFEIETKKTERLTSFAHSDELEPAWSPDGTKISFVSNQDDDPDRSDNSDVYVVDAQPNSKPRALTVFKGFDGGKPAWSPDGKWIAYLQGTEPKYSAYAVNRLAIVPADGSSGPRLLSEKLDRGVSAPIFTEDGRAIIALVADDRSQYPARFSVQDESVERLLGGSLVVDSHARAGGRAALLAGTDTGMFEVYALDGSAMRKLTSHNDGLFSELQLGAVEEVSFKSKDGTDVHGLLTRPPGFDATKKYPLLLRIHGGPNGQDQHEFALEHQFFAANGYLVIAVNYRGSSGRGKKFSQSIFADWGNLEVADLLAGVDHVLAMGIADPNRLGIGGWSYGGILTDYTIAKDNRFKVAISGAGSANQISMYGSDQYVFQYDNELGPPWKDPQAWVKISYPFFKATSIHTPTLFLGGDQDFNVPLIGGEQMYQALKTLGVPTELIIYPGQHHGIKRPSFQRDRLERYLAWYDKYLKNGSQPANSTAAAASAGRQ